jgi:hypothetical protein
MTYLPEGSTGVVVIDVKKALASPLTKEEPFKSQIEQAKNSPDFKKFTDAGLDPFTNLNTIVIAGKDVTKEEFAVILSGSFDAAKVAEKAKAEMKSEKATVEVLGTGMLAFGPKAIVDSAKAGKGLGGSPIVKDLLSLADNNKTIFAVGSIPAEALGSLPPQAPPQIKNIKGVGFSLDLSSGVAVSGLARFASDADATALKGFIDTILPMAKGNVPDEVLNNLKIEAKKTDLSITLSVTADQIKNELPKLMGGGRSPEPMPMPMPDPGAAPGVAPAAPGAP